DDDLIETDFGAWEGLTFADAAARDPELHRRWLRDTSVQPPGGESFDAVAQRVRRASDRIIAEHRASTVLVVSHVTPIKSVLRVALDAGAGLLYRLHLDLASLSIAEFYPDGVASVRLVNHTDYLRGSSSSRLPPPGGGHAVAMWDCIVIGGGAAGLSATLVLGRAKRQTLMIDAGRQSNLAARQVGGLLGQDGRAPADFYAAGCAEVASYPGVVVRHGAEVV